MKFSVKYLPTALFSLKSSSATNSGAKTLFLPSPYAIKMALLNQAITIGGDLEKLKEKNSSFFTYIKKAKISYFIEHETAFVVNNSFVKILKPAHSGPGLNSTVAFREYVFISKPIEIIFDVQTTEQKQYLKKYLHRINYFGKKGCFFQFIEYLDLPSEANVTIFNSDNSSFGILQEYDDFEEEVNFENVNTYSLTRTMRKKEIMILPLQSINSSKGFTFYKQG